MASVMKLRRDMIVADDRNTGGATPAAEPAPGPQTVVHTAADDTDIEDEVHGPTFLGRLKLWGGLAAGIAALAAYPAMVVAESDTGDREVIASLEPSEWTAPWAGAAAGLMQIHFDSAGWAVDAPQWAPAARLTAKPALQSAVAESLGEFLTLKSREATVAGERDVDLEAAARLLTGASTGVQMRAAFEALVSHDQRARRYAAAAAAPDGDALSELALIGQWASRSQSELAAAAAQGQDIIDAGATRAVYSAKGRAQAAYALIRAIGVHDDDRLEATREAALDAWRAVASFDPLLVLNGAPDSPLLGNHAASLGFLVTHAEAATASYRAAAARLSPVSGPGMANVVSASILAADGLH